MIARGASRIIRDTIDGAGLPAPFKDLLFLPLSQPGKILRDEESAGWSRLIVATSIAVHAADQATSRTLAAMEVYSAALDVLDEVEDGDVSPLVDRVGPAQAVNVATALLFIAPLILEELADDPSIVGDATTFGATLARLGLAATVGQYRDLSFSSISTSNAASTVDDALELARLKSGSLAACATRLTASIGTIDDVLLDTYEEFGRQYGTMVQIANDLHDAQRINEKSDLVLHKPTLPIVFYLRGNTEASDLPLSPDAVAGSGALHFAWVVFERERQSCRHILDSLAAQNQEVTALRRLVD